MAGPTVTVACKLPHGLILRLFQPIAAFEPLPGGGVKEITKFEPMHEKGTVLIKGYLEKHTPDQPLAAQGSKYALTHGVDKAFFDEWMKQNAQHDAVKNKLIFGSEKPDELKGKIAENAKQRSGLEPIDMTKLNGKIKSFTKEDA